LLIVVVVVLLSGREQHVSGKGMANDLNDLKRLPALMNNFLCGYWLLLPLLLPLEENDGASTDGASTNMHNSTASACMCAHGCDVPADYCLVMCMHSLL
jgi:hypothetical protein